MANLCFYLRVELKQVAVFVYLSALPVLFVPFSTALHLQMFRKKMKPLSLYIMKYWSPPAALPLDDNLTILPCPEMLMEY